MKTLLAVAVMAGLAVSGVAEAAGKKQVSGVVNLNTATAQQLDLLPGVGEKAAKRIIEYRAKTPFARAEDLVKVKGFGKKKFDRLKPFIAVSGATTVRSVKAGDTVTLPAVEVQGRTAPRR